MKVPPVGSSQMGWPGQVALGSGSWLLLSYKISKDDFTSKMGRTVYFNIILHQHPIRSVNKRIY